MPSASKLRSVRNPVPWYAPRFWHGMRVGTWLRELRRNGFAVSPTRLHIAASVTGFSVFNSALAAADRALYGHRVAKTQLAEPPLFIVGHWRSGTTFLHELLIRDPANTYANTYQCFAPHHFVLSQRWVAPAIAWLLPRRRPMDDMAAGWQRPQEDEFALCNAGVPSPYLTFLFPGRGPTSEDYFDLQDLSAADRYAWRAALAEFFQRVAYCDNRRIVVKSPPHTARVRTLLEMYPDAKFVHLVRNPYELYASTIKLWRSLHQTQAVHAPRDDAWVEEFVLNTLDRMYTAWEQDQRLLGDGQLVELRFEDLIDEPIEQLRRVYNELQLGNFSTVEPHFRAHLAEVQSHRRNAHDLDDATAARVRERWAPYFERYGYAAEPAAAAV